MNVATLGRLRHATNELQGVVGDIRSETASINASGDHIAIIRNFNDLRIVNEILKETQKALTEIAESLSREAVPEAMRAKKVKTLTLEGIGRITISSRWSASIIPEKKPLAYDWLRDGGNGSLIVETVNAQTLSSFAKDLFVTEGKELPDDMFKVGQMTYTSITKVT